MNLLCLVVLLAGVIPLCLAAARNRLNSLYHALVWIAFAWGGWLWVLQVRIDNGDPSEMIFPLYLAICLSGCAGVAVLGARRPQVKVWNLVVLGLLAVMLLPMVEAKVLGAASLGGLRYWFLAATLAVGLLNYLPTCFLPAALILGFGVSWALADLAEISGDLAGLWVGPVAVTPWISWLCWWRRRSGESRFDRTWLDFRDRYGLVWGQRVREQFNAAARNAHWPAELYWQGLYLKRTGPEPTEADQLAMLDALQGLLKRFGPETGR